MGEFNALTRSNMEMVLDEACHGLAHGGDHQTRKYVAECLIDAARSGITSRDRLLTTALRALCEVRHPLGIKPTELPRAAS